MRHKLTWHQRFNRFKNLFKNSDGFKLRNKDIDEICDFKEGNINTLTSPSRPFTKQLKMAIYVFEKERGLSIYVEESTPS